MAHGGKRDTATRKPVTHRTKPGEDEAQRLKKKKKKAQVKAKVESPDVEAAKSLIKNAKFETVAIDDVVENSWNPNRMQAGMYETLRKAIRLQGFTVPIVVREGDENGRFKDGRYEIIDGAHRRRILAEEQVKQVPVANVGCISDVKAKAATIQFNKIHGEHDRDLEGRIFADILAAGDDADVIIDAMPFSLEEMEAQASLANEEVEETSLSEVEDEDADEAATEPMWDVVTTFGLDKISRKRADKIITLAAVFEKKYAGQFSDEVGGSLLLLMMKKLKEKNEPA